MVSPFTAVMTSPAFKSAAAAGESSNAPVTSAPAPALAPGLSAAFFETGLISTPSHPLVASGFPRHDACLSPRVSLAAFNSDLKNDSALFKAPEVTQAWIPCFARCSKSSDCPQ
jgi:hypothetical protein